ncbi:macro domain-containing protein [Marinilactibacillus psychrotolerans]|uniref:Macro domain-containing protein n=3 Tax=Marinilactibacillus psychrotolerans TaxID=191770 RepID=A0A5R9C4K6_9LACT|nr:macro domain-containing protein [Marinilactibacillus psychrotolerans]TLQ07790.1 macro domain-containing protein [Marinilactibacillus psychrotolerans]
MKMMLLYVKQNIFESPAQVIVNAVNTVGVMGKGIAKTYKKLYPEMYKQYRYFCEQNLLETGKLWLYKDDKKWILNFPTKEHWKNPSKIEYIESGLKKFVETYEEKGIYSISFPQIGSGNGGLNWENEVKPLFEQYLKPLPIDIFVHIADKNSTFSEHKNIQETREWLRKQPSTLSVEFVWEDLIREINTYKINELKGINYLEIFNNESEERIVFETHKVKAELLKEDFYDLWIKLREYGYLFSKDLPSAYRMNGSSSKILQLLTLLPYIEVIDSYNNQNGLITGISVRKINLPEKQNLSQHEEQLELNFG